MTNFKKPTPEEINEAAEKYAHERVFPPQKVEYSYSLLSIMKRQKEAAKEDFLAAISWLQNYQTQQQGVVKTAEEILEGYMPHAMGILYPDIIKAMHEFHNQFQTYANGGSEWISVSKKLPNIPDEFYLIAVRNKNKDGGIWLIDIAVFDSDGQWQKSNVWEDVLFWQPLPAPPGQSSQPQPNAISVIDERIRYLLLLPVNSMREAVLTELNDLLTKLKKS